MLATDALLALLVLLGLAALGLIFAQNRRIAALGDALRGEIAEQSRSGLIAAFDRVQEGARAQSEQLDRLHRTIGELSLQITTKLAESENSAQAGRAQTLNETLAATSRLTESQTQLADRVARDLSTVTATLREEQATLRSRVEAKLEEIRAGNESKLESMRAAVDEKLQSALEKRIGESFQRVAQQFAEVQQAIGQVQSVATQVGDLKRLFSNVKARGGWGESQIRQILEDTLPPGTFEANFRADPNSSEAVEFAVRMPVHEGEPPAWLPIDAKFPTEDYDRLLLAAETADRDAESQAVAALTRRIRDEAKTIASKYIKPPRTTDIAVLFLPSEGLFAEVARIPGLVEQVQRDTKVLIQSPTLLPALLQAIRVGHFTVQLERKAGEIGKILSAVKTEWGKLGDSIEALAKRADSLSKGIDSTQVRVRAVGRALRDVEAMESTEAPSLLGLERDDNAPMAPDA